MKKYLLMAIAVLSLLVILNGCTAIPEITSAKVYINQQNYDKALEQAKLATEKVPDNAEAWFVLGDSYGYKKMYSEMNDAFKKSLTISPQFKEQIDVRLEKCYRDIFTDGINEINNGQLDQAAESFTLCTELLPNRADAYKNLGYTYAQGNKDSLAIDAYIKSFELDSTDMSTQKVIGILYSRNGEHEKCIEAMNMILANSDPTSVNYSEALYQLALSYDLLGQRDKAIEIYAEAIEKQTDEESKRNLLFNLGRLYFNSSDYEKAAECFLKVIESDPTDFDATFNTGNSYLQLKNYPEAIQYLEKAIELRPDNASAWNNLGIAAIQSGLREKGEEAFKKAEELEKAGQQ